MKKRFNVKKGLAVSWAIPNEVYFAFPFALNWYRSKDKTFEQITVIFLFLWVRLNFYYEEII